MVVRRVGSCSRASLSGTVEWGEEEVCTVGDEVGGGGVEERLAATVA
jgi:hypothetical protein